MRRVEPELPRPLGTSLSDACLGGESAYLRGHASRVPGGSWRGAVPPQTPTLEPDGHRIGAIRHLRWPGIDFEGRTILWRAEHEKTGHEHRTAVTAEALAVLEEARELSLRLEDTPVLPAPRDASKCAGRSLVRAWWYRAQTLAGLGPKRGRGWHSLRRKFASDLMDQPFKALCELGGWKTDRTVLQCYQRADEEQLRNALEARRRGSRRKRQGRGDWMQNGESRPSRPSRHLRSRTASLSPRVMFTSRSAASPSRSGSAPSQSRRIARRRPVPGSVTTVIRRSSFWST